MIVGLLGYIWSMVMNPFQEVTTITGDSFSARIVNCFGTPIVASHCALIIAALCHSMLDILDIPLSLLKINTGSDCICIIFQSMEKILLRHWPMYVVPSKMSTANLSTLQNHCVLVGFPSFPSMEGSLVL